MMIRFAFVDEQEPGKKKKTTFIRKKKEPIRSTAYSILPFPPLSPSLLPLFPGPQPHTFMPLPASGAHAS